MSGATADCVTQVLDPTARRSIWRRFVIVNLDLQDAWWL